MIDIVTVVFREELLTLKLQAESIDLYCQNLNIEKIFVVVNDDVELVKEIDPAWWGSLSRCVHIIHRDEFDCKFVDNGWVSQQVLKLLCSTLSENQYNMILDSKTIFVNSLDINNIFDQQGRQTWGYVPIQPVFEPAGKIVSKLFNINLKHIAGPSGIPFFFHNESVRSLINKVVSLTSQSFSDWFQQQGMVTEFILYTGYIQLRDGTLDFAYSNSQQPYTICNVCHSEVELFDQKFSQMTTAKTLTVSIHRRAWTQLSTAQKKSYQDLLLSRGITSAKDLL